MNRVRSIVLVASGVLALTASAVAAPLAEPSIPDQVLCLVEDLGVAHGLPADCDGDGYTPAQGDCADRNPAINPGAQDRPELSFADTNCDGIDGSLDSIFVSSGGSDAADGSRTSPVLTLAKALTLVAPGGDVLVAAGIYGGSTVAQPVGVFGGYGNAFTSRSATAASDFSGAPQGLFLLNANDVELQLLTVRGLTSAGSSTYGIRAVSSRVNLEAVTVVAGSGTAGTNGVPGGSGAAGLNGGPGGAGSCDTNLGGAAGAGGPGTRAGGAGGKGGVENQNGAFGIAASGPGGGASGFGGSWGDPGQPGGTGQSGLVGQTGAPGSGGSNGLGLAGASWMGHAGQLGAAGQPGAGGGGGGGGGGQYCFFCNDGTGNGGGGGGAGGAGGNGSPGGGAGAGSFGIYLWNSQATVTGGEIRTGNGGAGGAGFNGGGGGNGGFGGSGGTACLGEVGRGGNGGPGGFGGAGGAGGGGAGGPSIGIFRGATSTASATTSFLIGAPGNGGSSPSGNNGQAGIGASIS